MRWACAASSVLLVLALGCSPVEVFRQIQSTIALRNGLPQRDRAKESEHPTEASAVGPRLSDQDLPDQLPLIGSEGRDEDGYSRQHADQIALLNLLRMRHYDDLSRWMTAYEDAFEEDWRKETWVVDAVSAFETPDIGLDPLLDAWVERSTEHFAAWLARAAHEYGKAWHKRGHEYAAKTSRKRWDAFHAEMRRTRADLDRALALNPNSLGGWWLAMRIGRSTGDRAYEAKASAEAERLCPACYFPYRERMAAALPRWGGSYAEMRAVAQEAMRHQAENPRLAVLGGYEAHDLCSIHMSHDRWVQAKVACERALSFGPEPDFLYQRAEIYLETKEFHEAAVLLDRAIARSPGDLWTLRRRRYARHELGDWLGASRDLLTLRQLDPTLTTVAETTKWYVDKLRYEGDLLRKAGKADQAAVYFDLGLQLAPDDFDLMNRRGHNRAEGGGIDELKARVSAAPDDFRLRLELDHALAAKRRFVEVVEMWDAYLAAHPDDARAYRERGGAKWHLRQHELAIADMEQACRMGLDPACGDAKGMKRRLAGPPPAAVRPRAAG